MLKFFAFWCAAYSAIRDLRKFLKDLDGKGVSRFSDQWAWEVRTWLINGLLALAKNQDKGWRKPWATDNQFIRAVGIITDSDRVMALQGVRGQQAKEAAERALQAGFDPDKFKGSRWTVNDPVYPAQ
jgi:hypothetical protein